MRDEVRVSLTIDPRPIDKEDKKRVENYFAKKPLDVPTVHTENREETPRKPPLSNRKPKKENAPKMVPINENSKAIKKEKKEVTLGSLKPLLDKHRLDIKSIISIEQRIEQHKA